MLKRLLYRFFLFLYRVNQWMRQRLTPAGSLILGGVVAAGIFGVDTRQSLAFQVFAVCSSLMLIAVLSVFTFHGRFRLNRLLPDYATAGHPFRYRIRIENAGGRRQKNLSLIDELLLHLPNYREFAVSEDPRDKHRNWLDRWLGYPRLISLIHARRGGSIPVREIPPVPARDRLEVDMEFVPLRRGYLRFSCARLARPDPFGLLRAMQKYPLPDALLVLPRTYRVPKLHLPGKRKYLQGGLTLASRVGDSQEFLSLREYRPGDPLRSIHWRSYARLGVPIVKECQDEYFVRQGLVLDTFLENRPDRLFEEAVSVTASFQLSMGEQDALLDLMFIGDKACRFTSGRGFGTAANMLEILACVEPVRDRSTASLEQLLLRHATELSGLVMILLDWNEERRDLVATVTGRGIPVIVFVITGSPDAAEMDPGPLRANPERLIPLQVGDIQFGLDSLRRELFH